ncbi:MAG: phosphoribosyltransferase [Halobacteria archaeon]
MIRDNMRWDVDKAHVRWSGIESRVENIAHQIKEELAEHELREDITEIVGVSRGGLLPAVQLSHYLGMDSIETIHATHYDGDDQMDEVKVNSDEIQEAFTKNNCALLVDDIVDSGETMKAILDKIEPHGVDVYTVAIFVDPERDYDPDFWATEIDGWVVFPWEVNAI